MLELIPWMMLSWIDLQIIGKKMKIYFIFLKMDPKVSICNKERKGPKMNP